VSIPPTSARSEPVCHEYRIEGCDERLVGCTYRQDFVGNGGASHEVRIAFGDELAPSLLLVAEDEAFPAACRAHAWDCASSPPVVSATLLCIALKTGVRLASIEACGDRGGPICVAKEACLGSLCARARDADSDPAIWPAVAHEIEYAAVTCPRSGVVEVCTPVVVDPCVRRVGAVCRTADGVERAIELELSTGELYDEEPR
jgi:hypothetical protein